MVSKQVHTQAFLAEKSNNKINLSRKKKICQIIIILEILEKEAKAKEKH